MININQAVTLTFSLKYLVNCSKSTSLSQKVQLIAEQAQSILYILRQYSNLTVEQVQSILYILHSTLILPVGERGVAVEACCLNSGWWERTRDVILLQQYRVGIYSNNLVRKDLVCSCLVTSAAWEQINQSCNDCYLKYWFATY